MGSRLHGIPVILYEKQKIGLDPFGRPEYTEVPVTVENVLVGQPSSEELVSTFELTGKRTIYTLGIPKGDTHVWSGKKVSFFGETFRVIGKPVQGIESMIPLDWNRKVQVEQIE